MSYTVIVSIQGGGTLHIGHVDEGGTPQGALHAFCAKKKIATGAVADSIVLLGMTGSTLLHSSQNVSRIHHEPTEEALKAAFMLVRPARNWKLPINKLIADPGEEKLRLIEKAVTHYTGGGAEIVRVGKKVRVTAPGYYACIGS